MSKKQENKFGPKDYVLVGAVAICAISVCGIAFYLHTQNELTRERLDKIESGDLDNRIGQLERGTESLSINTEEQKTKRKNRKKKRKDTSKRDLDDEKEYKKDKISDESTLFDW